MDDKMIEEIKKEAEDIDIPESLSPENMRKKLDAIDNETNSGSAQKTSNIKPFPIKRAVTIAASLAVILGVGVGYGSLKLHNDVAPAVSDSGITAQVTQSTAEDGHPAYSIPGVMHSATSYDDVNDVISTAKAEYENEMKKQQRTDLISNFTDGDVVYEAVEESATMDSADTGAAAKSTMDAAAPAAAIGGAASGDVAHSDTNVRTEDVDEGDIVKTDGKYIYQYFSSGEVRIISIDNGIMEKVSSFDLSDTADAYVTEMYIKDDKMVLIAEMYETSLSKDVSNDRPFYYVNDDRSVHVFTYDIKDRTTPKKLGDVTIDGYFSTSRLVNGYLYVMTTYGQPILYYCGLDYGIAPIYNEGETTADDSSDDKDDIIPKINGEPIPAEDIMLPEKAKDEPFYVITSIKLDSPNETVDSKAVMGYVDQVYASSHSLFFYSADWSGSYERTEIVKFSYADGKIVPEAAGSVKGYIDDSFCIDEDKNGNLRVATTTWNESGSQESSLYILDKNMKKVGSLIDIAGNEGIKSCRFMGDMGYIVTFRNTDPLFTVDLSDPSNPRILSELTIPGFSEYLHYWGDGLLLGVGYDADIETGGTEGVKLSMFDVSDPKNTKEVAKMVLDVDYSELLYGNYKSILIDPEKNLFGFSAADWGDEDTNWEEKGYYLLFAYEDGEFKDLLTSKLSMDDGYWDGVRGLYAGDYFYLVHGKKITSYDMKDYNKISSL
ncbi:MAG: beta-propeller domain-containing protein [Lachnospiraceae bacterium]|nr:beta-propeller domain-containing protein [Lachnospiraceae bacterium]